MLFMPLQLLPLAFRSSSKELSDFEYAYETYHHDTTKIG